VSSPTCPYQAQIGARRSRPQTLRPRRAGRKCSPSSGHRSVSVRTVTLVSRVGVLERTVHIGQRAEGVAWRWHPAGRVRSPCRYGRVGHSAACAASRSSAAARRRMDGRHEPDRWVGDRYSSGSATPGQSSSCPRTFVTRNPVRRGPGRPPPSATTTRGRAGRTRPATTAGRPDLGALQRVMEAPLAPAMEEVDRIGEIGVAQRVPASSPGGAGGQPGRERSRSCPPRRPAARHHDHDRIGGPAEDDLIGPWCRSQRGVRPTRRAASPARGGGTPGGGGGQERLRGGGSGHASRVSHPATEYTGSGDSVPSPGMCFTFPFGYCHPP
jgi:hypothetical protein